VPAEEQYWPTEEPKGGRSLPYLTREGISNNNLLPFISGLLIFSNG